MGASWPLQAAYEIESDCTEYAGPLGRQFLVYRFELQRVGLQSNTLR